MSEKKITYKKTKFKIKKVEDKAVMIDVNGWSMRVRFEDGFKPQSKNSFVGKLIEVEYYGDIKNPQVETPIFKRLKTL